MTLSEILAISRLYEFRNAVAATLAVELPDVAVTTHPGKIDIADIVAGDAFGAPSIHVAISETRTPGHRVSALRDVPVKVTAYVVVEDMVIDERLVTRDELGLAICDALSAIAEDPHKARWGLTDIAPPEEIEMRPVLTVKSFERGTAFYAVTFRQVLTSGGNPFWAPDVVPPPILPPEPRS